MTNPTQPKEESFHHGRSGRAHQSVPVDGDRH
jgi:hypothetical protein